MTNPPRFSVLMPTHGKPGLISLAIQTWLNQSFEDFELLIVGDGCDDQTAAEVAAFQDPRIVFQRFEKGLGSGYDNRNKVLKTARGRYIAYAQHDDLVAGDHLTLLDEAFSDPDVVFAHTRPLYVSDEGAICPLFFDLKHPSLWTRFREVENLIHTGCLAHPRQVFETLGFFNPQAAPADYDFWRRMTRHYSQSAFKTITTPSVLHFRSSAVPAKGGVQAWGLLEARTMMQMAAASEVSKATQATQASPDYPKGLIWPIAEGTAPQASFHAVLQDIGSATFWRQVRQDTDGLRDLLAWQASSPPLREALAVKAGPKPPKSGKLAGVKRRLARLKRRILRALKPSRTSGP